jgi:hypothetical protein
MRDIHDRWHRADRDQRHRHQQDRLDTMSFKVEPEAVRAYALQMQEAAHVADVATGHTCAATAPSAVTERACWRRRWALTQNW